MKEGIVRKVIDKCVGEIEMIDSKHVLRVAQEELETVIPQIGGLVHIVNGSHPGSIARLLAVDIDNFRAKLEIEKGIYDGRVLKAVDYEDMQNSLIRFSGNAFLILQVSQCVLSFGTSH
ncbi:DNA/RNA-binding protein kin17 [Dionaea muscipula]